MTRAELRQQTLAALRAAPWPVTATAAPAVLASLEPLYTAGVTERILGTEVTTLRSWIGEWSRAG